MERAAIENPEFRSNFGTGALSTLWSDVAAGIKAEQDKIQKKRDAERELSKDIELFNSLRKSGDYEQDISISDGKIKLGLKGKTVPSEKDLAMTDYYKAQTNFYNKISNDNSTDIVYRHPITGEEVDPDEAKANIASGIGQYIVNQKINTKAGVVEKPLTKPTDPTESEKNYLLTSDRVTKTLDSIANIVVPRIEKAMGNKDWAAFQAQKLPFWTIGDQNIQDYKSSVNRLKSDIPFLRGGKQLTPTEAKRVDVLVDPFGKSKETYMADIQRFKEEFGVGSNLMKFGLAPNPIKSDSMYDTNSGFKTFNINGKVYNIPSDKVEAFKKAKGL
jgi:hypothetical protein